MFSCLKYAVSEILTDRLKVVFRGSEAAVTRNLEQEFKLRSMEPEAVDLLMAERNTADDRLGIKKLSSRGTQARVGRERLMRADPGPDRPHVLAHVAPLPPLPEQQEIVRRVESLFALAGRIEARFVEGQKRVDSITQAILAKAFRGELVPTEFELAKAEGRSFESAGELLKRIKGNGQVKQAETKPSR
jgi:hypothetical protein